MKVSEYIVKRLEELGINDFFGLPGDYNFNILYAIENNPGTKWIGCANELNAGYAADGYARIKGYGAVVTTYGVGELSAINAIAGSMAESVPVISIVGTPETKFIENKTLMHHNLQDVNYKAFFEAYSNVTAAKTFLAKDNAKIEIDRIIKTFVKEKKPVYVAIPKDVAQIEISDKNVTYEFDSDQNVLSDVAKKIADKITNSKYPVIVGDILIKRYDSKIEYKEFVEKSRIPVSNFLMGANLIDMEYEKYLGGYFAEFRNPIAQKYIEETDCLIAVGTIYSDLNSFGQSLPYKINNHIAIYGNYTYVDGKRYDNVKMNDVLNAVTKLIEPKDIEIEKPNIGYKQKSNINEAITTDYIYPRIQEFIKENDVIIAETGTVTQGMSQMKLPQNVDINYQALWGSIGWATPATLGACFAKPKSRVILITGEGAHQLTGMELGTILRHGLKPVIIVINNKGYTTERLLSNNIDDKFNDIFQMNYAKFARVFEGDVWATKVTTSDDFDKALKVTQIMNKMCYIEVCTEQNDAPKLSYDLANVMKKLQENISSLKSNNIKNIDNLIAEASGNGLEYETVVHKGFKLKIDKEEKNNE